METRKAKSPAGINQPCFTESVELCTCFTAADKLRESACQEKEAYVHAGIIYYVYQW